jgi:hypothetical protein
MPFLVVLGTGTWSAPGLTKTTFKASVCKSSGRAYEVDAAVAEEALGTGYDWLMVFDEEPRLDVSDPTGPLEPEDIKTGVHGGVRLQVEADAEPEEEEEFIDPEAPEMIHGCSWCPRKFPSSGALGRHVEFEHTYRHDANVAASIAEHEEREAVRAEQRRLKAAEEALPPWEREAKDAVDS